MTKPSPESTRLQSLTSNLQGWLEVDLAQITRNVRAISAALPTGTQVMAVVKANGYGMEAPQVARAARAAGATFLGVGTVREAQNLEANNLAAPFFLLQPCLESEAAVIVERGYIQAITHPRVAEWLSAEGVKQGKVAETHLNVNLGINRVGFKSEEVLEQVDSLMKLPNLKITGIFGHFSSSSEENKAQTEQELKSFKSLLRQLKDKGVQFAIRHLANSGGVRGFPESSFEMVRVGILMYGVYPSLFVPRDPEIQLAISLKARVVHVGRLERGEGVSYGLTWRAPKSGYWATIPLGSSDAIPSELSSRSHVLFHGKRFPIVGKVCMNITMLFLGDENADLGDEVVLLGRQGEEEITVDDWIRWGNLDPHEILTGFGGKLPKIHFHSK